MLDCCWHRIQSNASNEQARARARVLFAPFPEAGAAGARGDGRAGDAGEEGGTRGRGKDRVAKDFRSLSLTLNALSKGDTFDSETARCIGACISQMVRGRGGVEVEGRSGGEGPRGGGQGRLEGQYVGLILNAYSRAGAV